MFVLAAAPNLRISPRAELQIRAKGGFLLCQFHKLPTGVSRVRDCLSRRVPFDDRYRGRRQMERKWTRMPRGRVEEASAPAGTRRNHYSRRHLQRNFGVGGTQIHVSPPRILQIVKTSTYSREIRAMTDRAVARTSQECEIRERTTRLTLPYVVCVTSRISTKTSDRRYTSWYAAGGNRWYSTLVVSKIDGYRAAVSLVLIVALEARSSHYRCIAVLIVGASAEQSSNEMVNIKVQGEIARRNKAPRACGCEGSAVSQREEEVG